MSSEGQEFIVADDIPPIREFQVEGAKVHMAFPEGEKPDASRIMYIHGASTQELTGRLTMMPRRAMAEAMTAFAEIETPDQIGRIYTEAEDLGFYWAIHKLCPDLVEGGSVAGSFDAYSKLAEGINLGEFKTIVRNSWEKFLSESDNYNGEKVMIARSAGALATLDMVTDLIKEGRDDLIPKKIILITPLLNGMTDFVKEYYESTGQFKKSKGVADIIPDSPYLQSLKQKLAEVRDNDKFPATVIFSGELPADRLAIPFASTDNPAVIKFAESLGIKTGQAGEGMERSGDYSGYFNPAKTVRVKLDGVNHWDILKDGKAQFFEAAQKGTIDGKPLEELAGQEVVIKKELPSGKAQRQQTVMVAGMMAALAAVKKVGSATESIKSAIGKLKGAIDS